MNKDELTTKISAIGGVEKDVVTLVLNIYEDVIKDALQEGKDVTLKGFGKFTVAKYKPRTCRNLITGELIPIPERTKVKFKPSEKFM